MFFSACARTASPPASAPLHEALADCRKLPPAIRPLVRYLAWDNLPDKTTALKVLTFQINQLSRNPELIPPAVLSANLLRVNLIDYGWDREVWEKLANIDPYFHVQVEVEEIKEYGFEENGKWNTTEYRKTGRKVRQAAAAPWLDSRSIIELTAQTSSASPLVRADWWFVQTARQLSLTNKETGAGYYDWLGLKDRKAFEQLVKLNEKDSLELGKDMRAAVEHSGIAIQNRQINRLQSLTGGFWQTLDVDESTGDKNAIRNLKRGSYKAQASEVYGVLPNGLFAYFLNDVADGKRQSVVPDFIGPDSSVLNTSRDGRIHPCLGCLRCHVEGLRPIDDWVRRRGKTISSPDYKELADLRRQYFSNLNRQLERDRLVYREALRETNGLTPLDNAKAFASFWDQYNEPVDAEQAAVELGTTAEVLRKVFKAYPEPLLAGLAAQPSEPVRREHFEELFPLAMRTLGKR